MQSFNLDSIKQVNNLGHEYWSAYSLMQFLGYEKDCWYDFEIVIRKAMHACTKSDLSLNQHF
jgi:CRISPR/Cas system-associated endonuclease Cas3-HD